MEIPTNENSIECDEDKRAVSAMEIPTKENSIECDEDEPDDDFGAVSSARACRGKQKLDKEMHDTEKVEDQDSAEEERQETSRPPLLEGPWHQLQGVPRPNSDKGPRYLAWSEHGHVAVFPEELRMEIVFSSIPDAPQRIPDTIGLNMAAISPRACCFACGGHGSDGVSQMLIRPAEKWDKAVFGATLGYANEVVEAVACGDDFAACLTSKRVLRVYSLSGVPIAVISVPGESVAMSARGGCLFVVTRDGGLGAPEEGEDESLDFRLLEVSSRSQRAAGRLPISACARLRWIGISDEFAPVTVDTDGVVRALLGSGPGSWGPANGGGAEWTVLHQFSQEIAQGGLVWMVGCRHSSLLVACAGDKVAPGECQVEPQPPEVIGGVGLSASQEKVDIVPGERNFGFGAPLREIPWTFSFGQLASAGPLLVNAVRESTIARHVEDVGFACEEGGEKVVRESRSSRFKSALFLFASLIKSGEQEKALDVVSNLIAVAGGSGPLANAQALAERAGLLKLADRIADLPRIPWSAIAANAGIVAKPGTRVPEQASRPLFDPGEGEETQDKSRTRISEAAQMTPPRAKENPEARIDTTPSPNLADSTLNFGQVPVMSKSAPAQAAAASDAPAPAPVAPAAGSSNPFARRQQRSPQATKTPHLLRDALGGGSIPVLPPQQGLNEPPLKNQRLV